MKRLLLLGLLLLSACTFAADVAKISAADAAGKVAAGQAVLVDIREPAEWMDTGVATPALLMPKSEFDAGRTGDWKPFLEKNRGKLIILYCRSGRRADAMGAVLVGEGFSVANAGGVKDWKAAGLPIRSISGK